MKTLKSLDSPAVYVRPAMEELVVRCRRPLATSEDFGDGEITEWNDLGEY